MRIAVWYNLPSGGAKRALYDQVAGLVARGHEVEAWCPPTADREYLPLGDIVKEHVVPLSLQSPSEARSGLAQNFHPRRWSVRTRLRAMNRHCRECARQIHAGGFDLLFAACCMFFNTPSIARFVNIPRVVYLQEPNRWLYEAMPELPWLAASWKWRDLGNYRFWKKASLRNLRLPGIRLQAREERLNAMAFDRILVNSYFSRESVLRAFGIDSKVCYLGVDTNQFVNQNQARQSFAICVAAIFPHKNIEFLILALAKIPAARRPPIVLIANSIHPPYLERIRSVAKSAGVQFELKHGIEDSELVSLLNRARMMLYAPRLEPFGYAPLEANACGLPVVAVAEGGVRETVQDEVNGLLVEPEPDSMAKAIDRLSQDDELHRRLSEGGCRMVLEKWSLESSLDRLESGLMAELKT